MNTSEKRRGGAGHVLRAGTSHPTRQAGSTTGGANNGGSSHAGSGSNAAGGHGSTGMPVLPPKAAMFNNNGSGPDDDSAGGTAQERKDKDKDKEDKSPGGAAIRSSSKSKQKDIREREAAATAAQLREKDERIAYLEKEMTIAEREFQRQLDKLSANESETATFWQAKHSALNQQFLRTDTELRLLRAEVDVREGEREELRQGYGVLRRELRERDEEIRRLRGQVRGLKEWVSTSTRTDDQTSDEVFGDGMTRLGNGLQNWVIVNFRKAKLDLSKLDEATLAELSELVPMYEELVHSAKVHLLQSLVSRILVEMVFDAYYVGLSDEQTRLFRQMEKLVSNFDEPMNQWRSSTLGLLRRDAPDILQDETSSFAEVVLARINRLLSALTDNVPAPSDARSSALRVLVNNSIELARLLVVQKAVLRVCMPDILPHQRVLFEPDTMEDIGGEDEDALASREICCVVFPGIIKRGDENGAQMQYTNVIAKARVLCSPEE